MKRCARALAALLFASILATSVSAKTIFVAPKGDGTTAPTTQVTQPVVTTPTVPAAQAQTTTAPGGFIFNAPAAVYSASDLPKAPVYPADPDLFRRLVPSVPV